MELYPDKGNTSYLVYLSATMKDYHLHQKGSSKVRLKNYGESSTPAKVLNTHRATDDKLS